MTTTSSHDQHQHQQLKQDGCDINSEQRTLTTLQWKRQEHEDFYAIKKQNIAGVLSPLSSISSPPPTEPHLHSPYKTKPLPLLPILSSSPKAHQIINDESMPSPPPSALAHGMDIKSPNFRKQKSPSHYTFGPPGTATSTTATNMTRDQIKYCGAMMRTLKKHRDATPFIHPVDYVKLNVPDYPHIIKTPMDLTTINRKLQHKEYIDVNQFINDIRLLFNNCYKFNGPEAMVSTLCQNVESAFEKGLRQMPPSKKVAASTNEASSLQAISPIFRRNTDANRPNKRDTKDYPDTLTTMAVTPSPLQQQQQHRRRQSCDNSTDSHIIKRRKTDAQLKFCGQALRELKKNKYRTINYPFLYPVDAVALNIPDYHTIITHPMDISTIERNLINGEYNSAKDVESDVRLIFSNCYRYNPPALPIYKMAKELETVFDEKWKHLPESKPAPPPPSPSSLMNNRRKVTHHTSNDNDDDDDGDVSDNDDRIAELERHIATISQEIASIKSTKRKSSSSTLATGSKRKTLTSKKKEPPQLSKEKLTPTKTRRRPSTPTPKQQQQQHRFSSANTTTHDLPEFTFEQKKELSENINNLTGDRIRTVVNIIQSSMPNLDGQGQDEIVLDIDLLDRQTLHRLYEFVTGKNLLRKHPHQSKKRKIMENDQRLRASEESLRQINAGASSESGSSSSDSDDDSGL